jgi:hypothetical protein
MTAFKLDMQQSPTLQTLQQQLQRDVQNYWPQHLAPVQQQAVELGLFTVQQVEQRHLDISQAASASLQNLLLQADKGRSFVDWEMRRLTMHTVNQLLQWAYELRQHIHHHLQQQRKLSYLQQMYATAARSVHMTSLISSGVRLSSSQSSVLAKLTTHALSAV